MVLRKDDEISVHMMMLIIFDFRRSRYKEAIGFLQQ